MATRSNPDSWDSNGNLIVPRYGIRIVMLVALLAAAAFCLFTFLGERQWDKHHRPEFLPTRSDPLWVTILWFALLLVPFALSGMLLSRRGEESKAAGAGVGATLFGCGLVAAIAVPFGELLKLYSDPYDSEELIADVVFIACCLWIIVSAFRIAAKASWGVFFLTMAATLICMIVGARFLSSAESALDRQYEQRKREASVELFKPVNDAQHWLAALAGCLILNESIHHDEFPASLDPAQANWWCDAKFAADAMTDYTLRYVPQRDAASGRATDFQLIATPIKVVRGHYALMVDRRGIVFSDPMFGIASPYIRAATAEGRSSEVEELRGNIERYIKENNLKSAPTTLNVQAIGTTYGLEVPRIEDDGARLEIKNYAIYYLAPRSENPSHFALSVQCQSYGRNCLRSYFLDYDGTVHGTGEPRRATANDPPALACEESDARCDGILWPDS